MRKYVHQKYRAALTTVCAVAWAGLGLAACDNKTASAPAVSAPTASATAPAASAVVAEPVVSAGFKSLDVPAVGDMKPLDVKLWTPCDKPLQAPFSPGGPFLLQATPGCPMAGTGKYPLIVMSHGRGGTALAHHDTATALASAGFIVASFNHPGDNAFDMSNSDDISALYHRPAEVKRVIDHLTTSAPEAARIDTDHIGFFGFSRGGYTGLVLAGATPDFVHSKLGCADPKWKICAQTAGNQAPNLPLVRDPRIKAMVIADPLSFFPSPESVKDVKVPMQLWNTTKGGEDVTPEAIALLAKNLSKPPETKTMPNSTHLSMLHPCTPALAALEPDICTKDEPGFDRVAAHKDWNAQMVAFFSKTLAGK